ncbi:phosphotransferase enzyme family-domain-containing protein [Podospora australis]|uniref:Phosphotransferase enzyme family-domain-containing protein n=1 Tax=Podospora australis TaxID=1536484 RepID=A0AAN7AEH4_9PEZI|nr:phosphotransferase enzyme family-domain-containing protein [Podospora australis]
MRHPSSSGISSSVGNRNRDGLVWVDDNGLGPVARWTRQPDIGAIERVVRRTLKLSSVAADNDKDVCDVQFHANGEYSKLYSVSVRKEKKYILRVSLPVDPQNKTRGEVFTLGVLRQNTDIPVPKVIAYDDTQSNEIAFEWVLMEMMPGKLAHARWRKMSFNQKEMLAKRVADFHAQLFRCGNYGQGFRSIGTLRSPPGPTAGRETVEPGPIVDSVFFSGPRFTYPVPRGPFSCSHDWLRAYLNLIISEHSTALAKATSQNDKEHAEMILGLARKLLRMVHKIFPSLMHPAEQTILWHDDLSLKNILVDDGGRITGVIGWECVSALPRWMAFQVPAFLRGAPRRMKPDRDCYTNVGSNSGFSSDEHEPEDEDLDNEGKTELYWIHLMEYEQTVLREQYHTRMRQLRPDWDREVEEAALKVDFLGAVSKCGTQFYPVRVEQWVDAIDRKEFVPLMQVLRMGIKKSNKSEPAAHKRDPTSPLKMGTKRQDSAVFVSGSGSSVTTVSGSANVTFRSHSSHGHYGVHGHGKKDSTGSVGSGQSTISSSTTTTKSSSGSTAVVLGTVNRQPLG